MKKDKDIRAFMHENREVFADNDAFMADFIRKMDKLPVPASFEKIDEGRRKMELDVVSVAFSSMRRRNLRRVFAAVSVVVLACISVTVLLSLNQDALDMLSGTLYRDAMERISSLASVSRFSDSVYKYNIYLLVGLAAIAPSVVASRKIFSLK